MVLIRSRTFASPSLHHLLRRVGELEQSRRRLVDAGVGRLRRQHDGDQQRERIDVLQFGARRGIGGGKAAERFLDFGFVHCGNSPWAAFHVGFGAAPWAAFDRAALPLRAACFFRFASPVWFWLVWLAGRAMFSPCFPYNERHGYRRQPQR
jgi:hypothetical protein